jgi:hypothetical protein
MYELYDACATMFFFRNKHIMIDLGTGNNNKMCVSLFPPPPPLAGPPSLLAGCAAEIKVKVVC